MKEIIQTFQQCLSAKKAMTLDCFNVNLTLTFISKSIVESIYLY